MRLQVERVRALIGGVAKTAGSRVEVSLEKTIQLMKGGFSFRLKSKCEVWERGHFDKRVPDRQAYRACVTYIHQNPVVAGLVDEEPAYAFSSAARPDEVDSAPEWFL